VTVDATLFRQALAQFASGVTVVTAMSGDERFGFTASAFTSVSLRPPLVLVCAAQRLDALAAIVRSRAFGVNVLGIHQRALGLRFAGLVPGVVDRFEGVETTTSVTGSPLLPGSLACLDCRVWRLDETGDHVIAIGEVVDARVSEHHVPLLYHDRRWQRPAALDDPAEGEGDASGDPRGTAGASASLASLLRDLQPTLHGDRYVFVSAREHDPALQARALACVRETEGVTLVVTDEVARLAGLPASPAFRCITLQVCSDLLAVGLTAAVSGCLAGLGIPCNVVSAFHHDHVFVPDADADRAMAALRALNRD
jgi:flavin reductase (DIM6/NTAB) family NADH-FMN oxidoreductase RutF